MKEIKYNILNLYLIKISKWFMLVMPVIVLFYNENGLEQFHVFLLQAFYSVAIVVLEIPSGYFADALGRKNTLIAGSVLGLIGWGIYCFSYGFWGFLVAEVMLGVGQSFISGADSALLYDTLLAQKREKDYMKYEGRITSAGNFAEAIAGVTGGFLATFSLRTPVYFQTAVMFLAVPSSLLLVEPFKNQIKKKVSFAQVLNICKYTLVENKELKLNIVISAVTGVSTLSMAWFVQPYFKLVELPSTTLYGVLWTLLNLSVGITSLIAYRIDRSLGQVKTVLMITIVLSVCYLVSGLLASYAGIVFLFVFYMMRGVATPVLKDYINRITSSEIRATVLSIRSFIIRLFFAAIGPLLGYLTDHISLPQALIIAGITFMVAGIVSLMFFIKLKKRRILSD